MATSQNNIQGVSQEWLQAWTRGLVGCLCGRKSTEFTLVWMKEGLSYPKRLRSLSIVVVSFLKNITNIRTVFPNIL